MDIITGCPLVQGKVSLPLQNPSHFPCSMGGGSVEEKGCCALLKQQGAPGDEVGSDLLLILPNVAAKSGADLPHLGLGYLMPILKGFHSHGNECVALLAAELLYTPYLPLK